MTEDPLNTIARIGTSITNRRIEQIQVEKTKRRLKKPYVLSFTTLTHITSITANVSLDDGRQSRAEVVPLFGYSRETEESIWTQMVNDSENAAGSHALS